MYEPIRGGTRGGAGEFKWTDVSADKDRENYLGHSINAPTGRWQKNKDVHWYSRDDDDSKAARDEEIRKVKMAEEEALSVALGFKPTVREDPNQIPLGKKREGTEAQDMQPTEDVQLILAKEARKREKAEKKAAKQLKRAEKERRRAEREDRRKDREGSRSNRNGGDSYRERRHSRSRSPLLKRGSPPSRPPHRDMPFGSNGSRRELYARRSRSRSRSRTRSLSPRPPRREMPSDIYGKRSEPHARRSRSRSRSRSSTRSISAPPPRRDRPVTDNENRREPYERRSRSPPRRDSRSPHRRRRSLTPPRRRGYHRSRSP